VSTSAARHSSDLRTSCGEPDTILEIRGLGVHFHTRRGVVRAVDGIDLSLRPRELFALVGESGCGKTVTALTILGLTRRQNAVHLGEVEYRGRNLLTAPTKMLREVRGAEISMIFQDPLTSLNPLQTVGKQIVEILRLHTPTSRAAAWRRAESLLLEVGISGARELVRAYPHEFSGGMRQRAMIAMALACNPKILIADEPTTALDVTIQAQILTLIKRLKDEHQMAVILITHDLGVVAEIADTVAVMYAGRIVEQSPRDELFNNPQHPYTWGLLGSAPRLDRPRERRLRAIEGTPPSPFDVPDGCAFQTRCACVFASCSATPELAARTEEPAHLDACWLAPAAKRARRAAVLNQGMTV
jgi:peptide/nickel transport system ATP-binding protein